MNRRKFAIDLSVLFSCCIPVIGFAFASLQCSLANATVTASIVAGDLIIEGSTNSDSFLVRDNPVGGVLVRGQADLVNGVFNGVFNTGSTPINDIRISTGAGSDSMTLSVTNATGRLEINAGTGPDSVLIQDSEISKLLRVICGGGVDRLELTDTVCDQTVILNGGGGPDRLYLTRCDLMGRVNIVSQIVTPGSPASSLVDCVKLESTNIAGPLRVVTGNGPDKLVFQGTTMLSSLSVFCNQGDDAMRLEQCSIGGTTRIALGDGDDQVISADTVHVGQTEVFGSVGNDVIAKLGSEFDTDVFVNSGGGADKILSTFATFGNNSSDELFVQASGGNDSVYASDNVFNSTTTIDGGSGPADQVSGDGGTFNAPFSTINFEGDTEPDWMSCLAALLAIDC